MNQSVLTDQIENKDSELLMKEPLATGSRGRPIMVLLDGEVTTDDAAYMLNVSARYIGALCQENKLLARRNEVGRRRGVWIVNIASIYEYARVTHRVVRDLSDARAGRGRDRELSDYATNKFGDEVTAAQILQIDGTDTHLGQVWVRYAGTTGRKLVANFSRTEGRKEPLLGRRKFLIEVLSTGELLVFYKRQDDESVQAARNSFKAVIQKSLEAVALNSEVLLTRRREVKVVKRRKEKS